MNRHLWDAQVEYLTKAGFKVTAPDIAGFGESRIPQDPSMALMAEQVLSHVSRPAVFAGLSMVVTSSWRSCARPPDIVTGAIFMDTKASADTAAAREQRLRVAGEVLAADPPAIWPTPCCPTCWAPPLSPNARGRADSSWVDRTGAPEAVASAQRAMADRPDSAPTLRNYEGPAVVLWGDEDVISPTADQKAMLEMMPQAVARQIPELGI